MGFLVGSQLLVRGKRLGTVRMVASIRLRPRRRMKGGDVCSELVVFRERLRAIHFCALNGPFSEYPTDLNPTLPSTVFLLCASTRALSDVALSKTSSSNPLPGTQRDDRNQADGSGSGLGDECLVDKIYCRSCTQTAAVIDTVQLNALAQARNFESKGPPPLYASSRVPQAYTACYMIYRNQMCSDTFSSCSSTASH